MGRLADSLTAEAPAARNLGSKVRPAGPGTAAQNGQPIPARSVFMCRFAAVAVLLCLCFAAPAPVARAQAGGVVSAPGPAALGSTAGTAANIPSDRPSDPRPIDGPEKNSNEWQVWAAGSIPIAVFRTDPEAKIWIAGGTYARVLTDAHGPGILRGRFEEGFEIDPLIEVDLPHHPVYAVGITPVLWKWDFMTRRRLSPYFEIAGGGLWGNHQVVPGTTTFQFMPSVAVGVNFPASRSGKYSWTADVRFFHVSNAGITQDNPGLNTIQIRIGFGVFTHPKPRPAI